MATKTSPAAGNGTRPQQPQSAVVNENQALTTEMEGVSNVQGSTLAQKLGGANHTAATERYLAQLHGEASRLLVSADKASAAPRMDDVLELDRRLDFLLSKVSTKLRFPVTVLGSLSDRLSTHDWIRLLNEHLSPHDRLGYQNYVVVDSYDSLRDAVRFIFGEFEGLYEVAYYICLHVLVEALRLDYQRRQQQGLAASRSTAESVVRTCLQVTQEALPETWSLLLSAVLASENNDERAAHRVVEPLLRSARRTAMVWMGDAIRSRARKIVATVSVAAYRPLTGTPLDQSTTEMARFEEKAPTSQFPGMFWSLRTSRRAESLQNPPSESEVAATRHFLGDRVVYDTSLNMLLLPAAVLLRPVLYPEDVPVEMVMSTLGPLLADELYRALFPPPNDTDLWTSKTRNAIDRFEQCLKSLWMRKMNETTPLSSEANGIRGAGLPGAYEAGELLFWAQGARMAFAGLRVALSGFQRATNWASYWRRAQKSFFRRFCLLRCSAKKPTSRLRCLLPLANMVEFAEAFQCPTVAPKGTDSSYCELQ